MATDKGQPSSLKPMSAHFPVGGHAMCMATPAKKEKLCFLGADQSNNASSAEDFLQQGRSFGNWEKLCFDSPYCLQEALPPCSPSESENSSSAFSTIGSSSSSSSFFNDTCSYGGIGELSPSSVGSTEAKSTMVSPVGVGLQDMHIGSKLHAFTSTEKWDGVLTCIAPTQPSSNLVVDGDLDDRFLEFNFVQGNMIDKEVVQASKNVKSTCVGALHIHCDEGQGRGRQRMVSYPGNDCAIVCLSPANAEGFNDKTGQLDEHSTLKCSFQVKQAKSSKQKTEYTNAHTPDDASPYKTEHVSSHEIEQSSSDMKDDRCLHIHKDGLLEQSAKPKRALSRAFDKNSKHPNGLPDVRVDTCEYLKCVLECGSSPFDTDIGIDIASLKHLPASLTPCKEISLSRALSLHQSPHRHGRPPLIPTPKLNNTPHSAKVLNLEVLQRRSFNNACNGGDASPVQIKERRTSDVSDVSPANISRIISIIQDTHKIAKGSYVSSARNSYSYNGIAHPSKESALFPSVDGKYARKAARLPSPLAEASCSSASTSESPGSFSFKASRDWRSRSVSSRSSLKSTVRNLEAAFSGNRSVFIKSSSLIPEGADTPENSKNTDMVFVAPMESYPKQARSLRSPDKPLDTTGQCKEDLLSRVPLKGDAIPLSLGTHGIARAPKKLIKMPLSPVSHKHGRANFELLCKPLISASRSIYQLPAPKDVFGIDNPRHPGHDNSCHPGRNLHRLSSSALVATSSSMLQASVQCIVRDGLPCYSMTIEGCDEEVLIAKGCAPENCSWTSGPKWLYTFYLSKGTGKSSRVGGWRRWMKKESKKASTLIGVMQVSNRDARPAGSNGKRSTTVSEFVLYDGKAHAAAHSQSLRITSMDMPPHRRALLSSSIESTSSSQASSKHVKLSRLSYSAEREGTSFSVDEGARVINPLQASTPRKGNGGHRSSRSMDGWSDSDFPDMESEVLDPSLLSHMELAAIIISTPAKIHHNEVSVFHDVTSGGWGLKFLNTGIVSDISSRVLHKLSLNAVHGEKPMKERTSLTSHVKGTSWAYAEMMCLSNSSSNLAVLHAARGMENREAGYLDMEVCEGALYEKGIVHHEKSGLSECVTLVLPSGDHGLPGGEAKGPSSLIERWQSGGSCECGGWDIGCGIEVLSTGRLKTRTPLDANMVSSLLQDQPISIFSQGSKQELMLKLYPVKQGLFKLNFQGKLSTLRAFATAVAILYSCQALPSSSLTSDREA